MSTKKMLVLLGTLVLTAVLTAACAGPEGPAGPAGPAGPPAETGSLTCTECHNDTAIITRHKANWVTSIHGSGPGLEYAGERAACAGCHDGAAFSEMIAAGKNFTEIESGNTAPTHQDCRTCHQIHVTYTGDDWALESNTPVTMVTSGLTFDGGNGNLCANCHQARRYFDSFVNKDNASLYDVKVRFNTHYSVQADTLMGSGGQGVEGKPGAHYSMVENTCAGCHMGENQVHTFEPQLSTCTACHADAEDFNVNGFVTSFDEKYLALEGKLQALGAIDAEGVTLIDTADEKLALALWNYNLVHEDGSNGIHNPSYFNALLDAALAALE